jgi:hypothetical protein
MCPSVHSNFRHSVSYTVLHPVYPTTDNFITVCSRQGEKILQFVPSYEAVLWDKIKQHRRKNWKAKDMTQDRDSQRVVRETPDLVSKQVGGK